MSHNDEKLKQAVKDTGGPAFPVADYDHQTFSPKNNDELRRLLSGMTLRDYFAASVDVPKDMGIAWAEALAGRAKPTNSDLHFEWIKFWADADAAYRGIYADAMIAERSKDDPIKEKVL